MASPVAEKTEPFSVAMRAREQWYARHVGVCKRDDIEEQNRARGSNRSCRKTSSGYSMLSRSRET